MSARVDITAKTMEDLRTVWKAEAAQKDHGLSKTRIRALLKLGWLQAREYKIEQEEGPPRKEYRVWISRAGYAALKCVGPRGT